MTIKIIPKIKPLPVLPDILWGGLLTGISCLIFVAGQVTLTSSIVKISVIFGMLGLTLLIGGKSYFKHLFIPISYLLFAVSIFDVIFARKVIYFQVATAFIGTQLLDLLGIPTFRSGHVITLPHITLDVATACSGINHIIALCGLAVPLGMVSQGSRLGIVLLVFEAFFVGILANGMRVAAIGLWTHLNSSASVHGPMDLFLVSSSFGLGVILLFILAALQGKISFKKLATWPAAANPRREWMSLGKSKWAVATAIVILLSTISYMSLHPIKPVYLEAPFKGIPKVIGDWSTIEPYKGSVKMEKILPDYELRRTYSDSGQNRIHVYLGYFASQDKEKEIFASEYATLMAKGNERVSTSINSSFSIGHSRNERSDVFFGYIIDDKIVQDANMAKLALIKSAFFHCRNNAGIFIIETDPSAFFQGANTSKEENFVTEIVPFILSGLETY